MKLDTYRCDHDDSTIVWPSQSYVESLVSPLSSKRHLLSGYPKSVLLGASYVVFMNNIVSLQRWPQVRVRGLASRGVTDAVSPLQNYFSVSLIIVHCLTPSRETYIHQYWFEEAFLSSEGSSRSIGRNIGCSQQTHSTLLLFKYSFHTFKVKRAIYFGNLGAQT